MSVLDRVKHGESPYEQNFSFCQLLFHHYCSWQEVEKTFSAYRDTDLSAEETQYIDDLYGELYDLYHDCMDDALDLLETIKNPVVAEQIADIKGEIHHEKEAIESLITNVEQIVNEAESLTAASLDHFVKTLDCAETRS